NKPSWERYIYRLRDYLSHEFEWEDITHKSFVNHFLTRPFDYGVEWICDSPITANWRLKQLRSPGCHPWALRMAYYGPEVAEELERRQHRINAALADILREETER